MTDPIPARALLEAAWFEVPSRIGPHENVGQAMAATPSGAELLRRADRPEARVAEGLTVEMLAEAMAEVNGESDDYLTQFPAVRQANIDYAAEVLANLPAPRPPEPDRCQHTDPDGDVCGYTHRERGLSAFDHERKALRDALTAYGHHADDCEYALTVCTCGFTEAMRTLFVKEDAG